MLDSGMLPLMLVVEVIMYIITVKASEDGYESGEDRRCTLEVGVAGSIKLLTFMGYLARY